MEIPESLHDPKAGWPCVSDGVSARFTTQCRVTLLAVWRISSTWWPHGRFEGEIVRILKDWKGEPWRRSIWFGCMKSMGEEKERVKKLNEAHRRTRRER